MTARAHSVPAVLRTPLARVARRHLVSTLGSGCAKLLLVTLGLLAAQMLLDRALDLSRPVRACLLAFDLALLGPLLARRIVRPWLRRWRAPEAAFALQRRWPELGSRVISSVQLHEGPRPGAGSSLLVAALVEETGARVAALPVGEAVSLRGCVRLIGAGLAAAVLAAGVAAWRPAETGVLLRRVVLQNVPLPTATIVVPETFDLKAPIGGALELVARAQGVLPPQGRVTLRFADGSERAVVVRPDADRPDRFVFSATNLRQSFRYRFELGDGRGPDFQAAVLPTPVVESAEFTQEFPAYTRRAPERQPAGALALFAGARVKVSARLSLPVDSARLVFAGNDAPAAINLAPDSANPRLVRGEFVVPAAAFSGLSLPAVSRDGLVSIAPTVYPVRLDIDAPPEVAVLEPVESSESLVPTARLPIRLRVRDDFGVAKVELVVESAESGQTRVALELGENGRVERDLVPAEINPAFAPGTSFSWWIEAADNNDVTGPGIGRSDRRLINLVTLADKQKEMLRRLEEASRRLEDVARRQGDIREDIGEVLRRTAPAPSPAPATP